VSERAMVCKFQKAQQDLSETVAAAAVE
jgi:hypothetical protein